MFFLALFLAKYDLDITTSLCETNNVEIFDCTVIKITTLCCCWFIQVRDIRYIKIMILKFM